jgi:hypothetical protein
MKKGVPKCGPLQHSLTSAPLSGPKKEELKGLAFNLFSPIASGFSQLICSFTAQV